jgi:hypothetical protein
MADVPGPEHEEEVEYIEVYEEVTDEDDDAGEFVEQQQGKQQQEHSSLTALVGAPPW